MKKVKRCPRLSWDIIANIINLLPTIVAIVWFPDDKFGGLFITIFALIYWILYRFCVPDIAPSKKIKKARRIYKNSFKKAEELDMALINNSQNKPESNLINRSVTGGESDEIERYKMVDVSLSSPLGYALSIIDAKCLPSFDPDACYIEQLYDSNVSKIVAITAEPPHLWLDPTYDFYLANCYAATLIHKSSNQSVRLSMKREGEVKDEVDLLSNQFQFWRFFIVSQEHVDLCEKSILPSLKASQDLFGINSFYIIRKDNKMEELKICNAQLLKSITDCYPNMTRNYTEIIKHRSDFCVPEFLLLFYNDGNITLHTYFNNKEQFTAETTRYPVLKDKITSLVNCVIQLGQDDEMRWDLNPNIIKNLSNAQLIVEPTKRRR